MGVLQFQPCHLINGVPHSSLLLGKLSTPRHLKMCSQPSATRTQRIMENISVGAEVGGAGGAYSYGALKRLDQLWMKICSVEPVAKPAQVVTRVRGSFKHSEDSGNVVDTYDVIVCGGTLGIFIATALSAKGLKVAIVERNVLKGREQEWNISRKELLELVKVGILDDDDIEQTISATFNPNRCGFEGKGEIWTEDILNLGISPQRLVDIMKDNFNSLGGRILEGCGVSTVSVYDNAAVLELSDGKTLLSELIIDAMGNFSPIVRQVRNGRKPDGVCVVVGSCARGFRNNSTSDVIYSSSAVKNIGRSDVQLFWEAFPAGSGPSDRTTYMFTYVDPQPGCPTLEELLESYWELMPNYQFGDASGIQSPVSFGGFGSLTRHLERLSSGIYSLQFTLSLDKDAKLPNLSASWLFQRAMCAKQQPDVSPSFINDLLHVNFQSMEKLGDPVLRPFLQDVIQFGPLVKTLGLVMLTKPQIIPSIFKQVGIPVLLDWSGHFFMLGYYTFLSVYIDPLIRPSVNKFPSKMKFQWKCYMDAWKYGAGLDYRL
ncbi:hypothetical protein KSS87_008964 [Heliosperma pusillum]|nr:hypothetical protein KSS87_008964 [Heliosperma pusillum]